MEAPLVIRSDIALAGWMFMAVWSFGMVMMTGGYFASGGFHQFDPMIEAGVVLLFWVFTLGGASEVLSKPRTRLTIDRSGGVLVRIWPTRRSEERIDTAVLAAVDIVSEKDEEDYIYRLELTLTSGEIVTIRRSHELEEIQALRRDIVARA